MQLDTYMASFKTRVINPIRAFINPITLNIKEKVKTSSTYKDLCNNENTLNWDILLKYWQYTIDIILFQKMLLSMFLAWSFYKITNKHSPYLIDTLYIDITRNGCIPVKLTQWYMTRFNLISEDTSYFVDKFKNLYENCEIHDIKYTRKLFKDTFKEDINLDSEIPIASGSIGQVYKGTYNGKCVAIKVMHPDIENKIFIPRLFFVLYNLILKNYLSYICFHSHMI